MARVTLDQTNNESLDSTVSKLNTMLMELYDANVEFTDWSGTTVTASGLATVGSLTLDTGTKTATATAGAATLNKNSGVITTEALTTAADAEYELTLTNSTIGASDIVLASVQYGTSAAGVPVITRVTPASGSVKIRVLNAHASAAFDGTLKISFAVLQS